MKNFKEKPNKEVIILGGITLIIAFVGIGLVFFRSSTDIQKDQQVCEYNDFNYSVGDKFQSEDLCNECECTEEGVVCTEELCEEVEEFIEIPPFEESDIDLVNTFTNAELKLEFQYPEGKQVLQSSLNNTQSPFLSSISSDTILEYDLGNDGFSYLAFAYIENLSLLTSNMNDAEISEELPDIAFDGETLSNPVKKESIITSECPNDSEFPSEFFEENKSYIYFYKLSEENLYAIVSVNYEESDECNSEADLVISDDEMQVEINTGFDFSLAKKIIESGKLLSEEEIEQARMDTDLISNDGRFRIRGDCIPESEFETEADCNIFHVDSEEIVANFNSYCLNKDQTFCISPQSGLKFGQSTITYQYFYTESEIESEKWIKVYEIDVRDNNVQKVDTFSSVEGQDNSEFEQARQRYIGN